ncbi:YaaA family protein [Paramicrobacterium fandaimingii]|uniref:YaaA family protein n=1 Tax=Paramicrobacterium fandaimingii TaxID=2708079 RepID=UPI0014246C6E|nr:peroxide stress protein YaaA [Microbacterium fandaimingii]
MLILLPPSETKRAGGTGLSLSAQALRFPELAAHRSALLDALTELAKTPEAMVSALKLGPKQRGEVDINGRLLDAPTMPALDRYTGVLFEALDSETLTPSQRAFADRHVVIHSALFGLVHALDPIPAYRLSQSSRIPGLSLKKHWRDSLRALLAERNDLIIDMRSEGYAELGAAPDRVGSYYVRVLTTGSDGRRRALNHFNKKAKGEFARAVICAERDFTDLDALVEWAAASGWRLERTEDEIALIV